MIDIQHITKQFSEGRGVLTVLQNLSFSIKPGEKVAIMGASGSGKTTLLQIIGGLDRTTSGSVRIDGQELSRLDSKSLAHFRNTSLGFIFQFHHLLSDFTALENVFIPGLIQKKNRKELEKRAKDLLKDVGLDKRFSHLPSELSGGERQRVALARALFNNPALILADEPTGNLDRENTRHFLEIVDTLNKKNRQTFLIATHDEEVADFMDYRLILENGSVVKRG